MDSKCKNRRLCDKIRTKSCGLKKSVSNKGKCSNTKSKSKKNCQSTFSMIKFYESIPNYEQVRDLPDFDFTERVSLLKKIHCDLSQPLINKGRCEPFRISSATSYRKKTGAKKKKRDSPLRRNTISPSLCRSFSKTTLNDFDEMDDDKTKSVERFRSVDSNRTSTPLKRLKMLREKLSTTFFENEFTNEKPRHLSPTICSPIFSEMKSLHSFDMESHPCDLYFNNCHLNFDMEYKPPVSFRDIYSPPKQTSRIENKNSKPSFTITSPQSDEEYRHRRAKSCPKELFESKKPYLNFQTDENVIDSSSTQQQQHAVNSTPSFNAGDCNSSVSSRPQRHRTKIVSKSKPKTPNSMDEYLSSKMVRSNLAANLREKWSRKRINEMAEEKLKTTMTVAKCIPKCHRWHVKNTNAWKSFTSEDTQTEKRLRELTRKEEQRLRQHAHAMAMNIMRAKVESAQLLLEGRALSAKS